MEQDNESDYPYPLEQQYYDDEDVPTHVEHDEPPVLRDERRRPDEDDDAPLRPVKAKKKRRSKQFASPKPPSKASTTSSRVPPTPAEPSPQVLEARKELPYDFDALKWDANHQRNEQERYCYCGEPGDWYKRMLQCGQCLQWFHQVKSFKITCPVSTLF